MKKIFSILAAAVIALTFASCEKNGGTIDQNGFKITVDSITATGAHATVTPADTNMYYGVVLYKTKDVAKVDTLVAQLTEYVADLSALAEKYKVTLDDLVNYEYIYKGVFDESIDGIPSSTDFTFVAFEIKEVNSVWTLGKYASIKFSTKELKPEKTVALTISSAEYSYYESYGLVQLSIEDETNGLTMGLVFEAENMTGTFTEEDFYEDGQYVYNYVEWGKGDNDWAPLSKLQLTGKFNEETGVYAIEGAAIGENLVEYTFKGNATEHVASGAPAKAASKAIAPNEFKAAKSIDFVIVK